MVRFDLNIVRNWYDEAKEFVKAVESIAMEALQTSSPG
jgi:hypothetical protein